VEEDGKRTLSRSRLTAILWLLTVLSAWMLLSNAFTGLSAFLNGLCLWLVGAAIGLYLAELLRSRTKT
jgi:hypothetical protein